ncbi:MAG: phosphotransferase, partial [Gammaproteobacteria bacterium]|nr:phosphotransferase [Gammaproteobacteria bacterium]
VNLVSVLVPDMASTVEKALKNVVQELNQCRQFTPALVHRDFYEKQILIDGDETILLDFDTLCMADPALDVGNFIAHLELNRLQGILEIENAKAIFSDAYEGCQSDEFQRRVMIYTQSAALRLACLYAFWPRWRRVCEPLLQAAGDRGKLGR